MHRVQFRYMLERVITNGTSTGAIEVQARKKDIRWSCNGLPLKYMLERERYLMVMQWVQLKYRLERVISDDHAKGAIEAQALEKDI